MFRPNRASAFGIAALCGLFSASITNAQSFRDALPVNSTLVVSLPDIKTSIAEAKSSPLGRMWAEKELQEFLGEALALLENEKAQAIAQMEQMHEQGAIPLTPDQVRTMTPASVDLAVTSLKLGRSQYGDPIPEVGLLLHLDGGDQVAHWKTLIDFGANFLASMDAEFVVENNTIGGHEMLSLSISDPDVPYGLHATYVGNSVLVGTIASEVAATASAMSTGKKMSNDGIQTVASKLHNEGAEISALANIQPLLDFVLSTAKAAQDDGVMPLTVDLAGVERVLKSLGLRDILGLGFESMYNDGRAKEEWLVASAAPAAETTTTVVSAPVDRNMLAWIPKEVAGFTMCSVDLANTFDSIVRTAKAYNPEMVEQGLAFLAQGEEELGFSLRNDLFGAFGERMVQWRMPIFGTSVEYGLIMEVKNQDAILKTLSSVAETSDGAITIKEYDRRGLKGWAVTIDLDLSMLGPDASQAASMLPSRLRAIFTFKDQYMAVSSTSSQLRELLKRMDRNLESPSDDDVRTKPGFAPNMATLAATPANEVSMLSYQDWRADFESVYSMLALVLTIMAGQMDDLPVDFSLLPEMGTLSQHIDGTFSCVTRNSDGLHAECTGPWGAEVYAILVGAVIAAAMFAT